MNDEEKKTLMAMVNGDNIQGAMEFINRVWMNTYRPKARFASVMVDEGEGIPMSRIIITSASS